MNERLVCPHCQRPLDAFFIAHDMEGCRSAHQEGRVRTWTPSDRGLYHQAKMLAIVPKASHPVKGGGNST